MVITIRGKIKLTHLLGATLIDEQRLRGGSDGAQQRLSALRGIEERGDEGDVLKHLQRTQAIRWRGAWKVERGERGCV